MPTRTSAEVEQRVLDARIEHRTGQDWLGAELDLAARTALASCAVTTSHACAIWTRSPVT
jgi:hypothetical protein